MQSGALASLAATLGSQREITRLRLCFEHVTFESARIALRPRRRPLGDRCRPTRSGKTHRRSLAGCRPVAPGYDGLFGAYHAALSAAAPLPVTLADARCAIELATALYCSAATGAAVALPLGPDHPGYGGWCPAAL